MKDTLFNAERRAGALQTAKAPAGFGIVAVVLANPEGASLTVACLTVLDRLVVSLSRAGVSRIVIVGETRPTLARAEALGLRLEFSDAIPAIEGEVLMAEGDVLVSPEDLARTIAARGRLISREGILLPVGVVHNPSEDWPVALAEAPRVEAGSEATLVTWESVSTVEQAYWVSLTSTSDGWVDRHFNRPLGRLLSKRLIKTPVSPNQVSVFATLVGLAAAWLFARGSWGSALAGAIVLQISAILDCIDGDLARALYKQSPLGKWLDIAGDQVVHLGVFLGIGVGLWRSGSDAPVLILGCAAALGVILSFLVILRALSRPNLRRHGRVQKLIDATTNRDFSVLLILFAWAGILDWFLWLAAVGSHLFWLAAAALQYQTEGAQRDADTA